MCESCGCGGPVTTAGHGHDHPNGHDQAHAHGHDHGHDRGTEVAWGGDLLEHNRRFAERNRAHFADHDVAVVNVLGSPGAGKTTLLATTIERLSAELTIGVITGDLAGDEDRRRLVRPGVAVHQIETGRVCHLDAHMVGHAAEHLPVDDLDLLFLENVGNLVCPASFDLGESKRVVVLSMAEGDDKPSKYPEMFRSADLVALSKCDLAPHVNFDRDRAVRDIRRLRFTADILPLSARTGEGIESWLHWLRHLVPAKR